MIDQRKHRRFDLKLPMEIVQAGELSSVPCQTMNISSIGVLFRAKAELPLGESVEYLVTLPDAGGADAEVLLRCMGKLLRAEGDGCYAASLDRYEFVRVPRTAVLESKLASAARARA